MPALCFRQPSVNQCAANARLLLDLTSLALFGSWLLSPLGLTLPILTVSYLPLDLMAHHVKDKMLVIQK